MTNSRKLGMEYLEDRKLMTVMTEFVDLVEPVQIGSEHWPEPAAEIAVEEMGSRRLSLHNNGAFLPWHRGYIKSTMETVADDAVSTSDSGRGSSQAYELKNVLVTSIVDQKESPTKNSGDTNALSYTEVEWTYLSDKKENLHNNGAFQGQMRRAATDIVMQELEHGPGLHDSVHCLTGQHDRPGQVVTKLGGQEGEAVMEKRLGRDVEDITVTSPEHGSDKVISIPSRSVFETSTDIVFGQLESLEHGPGLHDSVHCLTGQHDRPGQVVTQLGGQEGEAVNKFLPQNLRQRHVSAQNLGDQVSVIWPDF